MFDRAIPVSGLVLLLIKMQICIQSMLAAEDSNSPKSSSCQPPCSAPITDFRTLGSLTMQSTLRIILYLVERHQEYLTVILYHIIEREVTL